MSERAERYERLHAIFDRARDLSAHERARVLDEECATDEALRVEVEELLAQFDGEDLSVFSETGIAVARGDLEGLLAEDDAWIPERVGPYRVLRRIAEGGMGVVYEAEQYSPRRRIALKVVHPLFATPTRLKRFRQEAELLGRLAHPGVAQIHEAGTFDVGRGEQPFFAMEFVEGADLATHVKEKQLPLRARLALLADVCDAVHHAHEQGVIHRDLKPDNVLVDARGQPKVLDFGVAHASEGSTALSTLVTQEGDLLGTIAYMSPEQLSGVADAITPRADVYALGVIAYELLGGRLPHDLVGLPLTAAMEIARNKEPDRLGVLRPELRGDVETIVGKALEKESERRYASAADLAADIRTFLDNRPITARPPSRIYRAVKFTRRNKALVGGTLTTVVAILVGLVASLLFAVQSERNAVLAREGEQRAIGGVLQATQDRLQQGDLWGAAKVYRRVLGSADGWEAQFLEHALPKMLPERYGARAAAWVDDEHLAVAPDEGGVHVLDTDTWRETRRFLESHRFSWAHPVRARSRCEWVSHPQRQSIIVDLETGRVLVHSDLSEERNELIAPRCVVDDDGRARVLSSHRDLPGISFPGALEAGATDLGAAPVPGSLHVSSDGRRLAIMDKNAGILRVFDTHSGALTGELGGFRKSSCGRAFFVPDTPELLAFSHDYRLVRVDLDRMEIVRRYESIRGDSCSGGDLSSDGTLFAHAPQGRPVEVFDLTADRKLLSRMVKLTVAEGEHEVLFSPSGGRLLVTGEGVASCILELDHPFPDPQAIGTDEDPRVVTYRGHTEPVHHLAVSPDGELVASMTPVEPLVRVWSAATGETLATFARGVGPRRSSSPAARRERFGELMSFSPDGRSVLLTSFTDASKGVELVIWDLLAGGVERRALGTRGEVAENEAGQHLLWIDAFVEELQPASVTRLGRRAAFVPGVGALALDRTMPGNAPGEGWTRVGLHALEGMSVSPGGELVAVSGWRTVEILDLEDTARRTTRFEGDAFAVAWSPDGRLVAAGGRDGTIRLYDAEVWSDRLRFQAHDGYVYSLAWTPDGTRLVSSSGDGTVRVWDARTPDEREAARSASEARVAPLRGLAAEELSDRFENADTVTQRGAVVRAALELRAPTSETPKPAEED